MVPCATSAPRLYVDELPSSDISWSTLVSRSPRFSATSADPGIRTSTVSRSMCGDIMALLPLAICVERFRPIGVPCWVTSDMCISRIGSTNVVCAIKPSKRPSHWGNTWPCIRARCFTSVLTARKHLTPMRISTRIVGSVIPKSSRRQGRHAPRNEKPSRRRHPACWPSQRAKMGNPTAFCWQIPRRILREIPSSSLCVSVPIPQIENDFCYIWCTRNQHS